TLAFTPAAAGARSATLGVSATPGGLALAALDGLGLAPGSLVVTPGVQDFGTALTESQGGELGFTVRNTAETPTGTLSARPFHGDHSRVTQDGCAGALGGVASCAIKVRFEPHGVGGANDTLIITDAGGGNAAAQLIGRGLSDAVLSVAPPSLDFGMSSLGAET